MFEIMAEKGDEPCSMFLLSHCGKRCRLPRSSTRGDFVEESSTGATKEFVMGHRDLHTDDTYWRNSRPPDRLVQRG
jgi:hypothetical protein